MPQLDKFSFLTQFFWLCFFFIGFYLVLAKSFLPVICQILKLRQIKISGSLGLMENEALDVKCKNEIFFLSVVNHSKESLLGGIQNIINWSGQSVRAFNETYFVSHHENLMEILGKISVDQHIMMSLINSPIENLSAYSTIDIKEDYYNLAYGLYFLEQDIM